MTAALAFLDTETTGLHPDRLAWEVAIIRRGPGRPEARFHAFIDVPTYAAEPFALRVGRYYERHPAATGRGDAMPADEAARSIEAMTRGAQLVGSNPAFDAATLDPMLRDAGLCPSWDYRLIDVVALAAGHLPRTRRPAPPWRSYELSEALGVPRPAADVAHTAMGDAEWTAAMYDRIMGTR